LTKEGFISKLSDNPKEKISWLLEKVRLPEDFSDICIKANLNDYRKWETASTSDPYILDALLSVLTSRFPKASITIIENFIQFK